MRLYRSAGVHNQSRMNSLERDAHNLVSSHELVLLLITCHMKITVIELLLIRILFLAFLFYQFPGFYTHLIRIKAPRSDNTTSITQLAPRNSNLIIAITFAY